MKRLRSNMSGLVGMKTLLATIGVLLAAGLIFYVAGRGVAQDGEGTGAPAGPPVMPPPEVEVVQAAMKTPLRVSELVGRIESSNTVEIRARVEGFLEKQLFADGDVVKKGQSLFAIESKSYTVALDQAKAELARAKATLASARKGVSVLKAKAEYMSAQATRIRAEKDLSRIKPLIEADAASKQALDAADATYKASLATEEAMEAAYRQAQINQATEIELAEASVKVADAAVAGAELKLSYTDVRSPIDGRIGRAQQLPGALVGKDMASPTLLATISPIEPMWATWSISEQEYLSMMDGDATAGRDMNSKVQKVELILANGRTYPHSGRINFVDRAIDLKTGALAMRGEFANPNGLLRDGQFCKVRITRKPTEPSLMIPQRAVQEMQGESFVFVVQQDATAEQRKIRKGERIGDEQVVLAGLKAGERVVTGGVIKVQPGIKVKPVETRDVAAKRGQ